jgi:hypothetical protein
MMINPRFLSERLVAATGKARPCGELLGSWSLSPSALTMARGTAPWPSG